MQIRERFRQSSIPAPFHWYNQPARYEVGEGLAIFTDEKTDFWQRTHYGFRRDNGHCLFVTVEGDFALTTYVEFRPRAQYDQCGLMVRVDGDNWIKVSTETESETWSRLGSVVTNLGFSDWATQDIPSSHRAMWYRVSRNGPDFYLEHSYDGQEWLQLRVTHLHEAPGQLEAGVYACSPVGKEFWCRFDVVEVSENGWGQSAD